MINTCLCELLTKNKLGFKMLTSYTQEEVIGQNCRFFQGPHIDPEVVQKACLLHSLP
jgi:hypothetical protein